LPAFLDRYLAKNVYGAQETKTPVSPARRDNLMTPVAGFHRARGRFGDEAANSVVAVPGPLARLIPVVASGLAGLSLGLLLSALHRRKTRPALRRSHFGLLR
jgi:hypothetical protein